MKKSTEIIKEGLHFATVKTIVKGTPVKTRKGQTERIWVTFLSSDKESVKTSILLYARNALLRQLKSAAVGESGKWTHASEIIGREVVIDVEHVFTGMNYYANVVGIYDRDDYEEVPDDEDEE